MNFSLTIPQKCIGGLRANPCNGGVTFSQTYLQLTKTVTTSNIWTGSVSSQGGITVVLTIPNCCNEGQIARHDGSTLNVTWKGSTFKFIGNVLCTLNISTKLIYNAFTPGINIANSNGVWPFLNIKATPRNA